MKIIAINGSPRKGGNTETLLQAALLPLQEAGMETELIQIGGKPMRGCMACNQCGVHKNGRCVMDSDRFNEIMEKICAADAVLLGSPTYFADVTAEMKALIDRAGYVSMNNGGLFRRKVGAAVVTHCRAGAIQAFDTMNHLFQITGMITPGSTGWNIGLGLEKGDTEKDTDGLANMKDLGETMTWLLKAIAAAPAA